MLQRKELNVTEELDDRMFIINQKLIGILSREISTGFTYIMTEFSCSSRYLCYPQATTGTNPTGKDKGNTINKPNNKGSTNTPKGSYSVDEVGETRK